MPDQAQCNRNPSPDPSAAPSRTPGAPPAETPQSHPSAPLLAGLTPTAFLAELSARLHRSGGPSPIPRSETKAPQRTWEEGPYTLDRARVVLDEMANYLCFVRDRLEDHAERLPKSREREAQLEFETPYEVSTEMWQVASDAGVQLSELIDRIKAAAWVTQEELDAEFEELAEAAAG